MERNRKCANDDDWLPLYVPQSASTVITIDTYKIVDLVSAALRDRLVFPLIFSFRSITDVRYPTKKMKIKKVL